MSLFYRKIDQNKIQLDYKFYPLNLVILLLLVAFFVLVGIGLNKKIGIFDSLTTNIIGYAIIFLLIYFIAFKHLLINRKVTLELNTDKLLLSVNNRKLDLHEDEIRIVIQNLSGRYGETILTKCYLEQGYGVKRKQYDLASCIFEYDGILLSRFIEKEFSFLEPVKLKSDGTKIT